MSSHSYLVRTPGNPDYTGKVFGIPFANGRAVISEHTVDKRLGWSVEQIVHSMKYDFGYEVIELAAPADQAYPIPEGYELIPKRKVNKEIKTGAPVLKEEEPEPAVKAEDIPGNAGLVGGPEPVQSTASPVLVTDGSPEQLPAVVYQHESVLATGEINVSKPEPEPAVEPEPDELAVTPEQQATPKPAQASPKQKRATRRKGAEESEKPAG